jgi:hypothetical protein
MKRYAAAFVLRTHLYTVLPASFVAWLILAKLRPEDLEWAREQLKDWPGRCL